MVARAGKKVKSPPPGSKEIPFFQIEKKPNILWHDTQAAGANGFRGCVGKTVTKMLKRPGYDAGAHG